MPSLDAAAAFAGVDGTADAASPSQTARLSAWSVSRAKRCFDVALVCTLSPFVILLLLIIAAAVRLSSPGPAFFRQTRVGFQGRPFTILKFRTMLQTASEAEPGIACESVDRITRLGSILRKLKLDELPQVLNVLRGDMSLVGPRPRIADQQFGTLSCRPGITGSATLIFAREDLLLAKIRPEGVGQFYRDHIIPIKHRLDSDYMARATVLSDVHILFRTVLACWHAPEPQRTIRLLTLNSVLQSQTICESDNPRFRTWRNTSR